MADIGKLVVDGKEATLSESGEWSCDDRNLLFILTTKYNPLNATGVDVIMPFGVMALSRAAGDLGGKAKLTKELEPLPEGVVS